MQIFRNKTFFYEYISIAALLAVTAVAVLFFSIPAGIIVAVAGAIILVIMYFFAGKRYKAMEQLSIELDEILHDNDRFLITECEEGELAILSSSIRKMTVKLKEQASQLQDEKKVLTDAIADIECEVGRDLFINGKIPFHI